MSRRLSMLAAVIVAYVAGMITGHLSFPPRLGAQSGGQGTGPTDRRAIVTFVDMRNIDAGGANAPADCVDVTMAPAQVRRGSTLVDGVVLLCERK